MKINIQEYMSLRVAVMIWTILVNTHTHTHTDVQLLTGSQPAEPTIAKRRSLKEQCSYNGSFMKAQTATNN